MQRAGVNDRRAQFSWALYDFANSSFTTLVVTFVYAAFFVKALAPDEIIGTAIWSRGVTITSIVVAVCSPFLGALADRGGYRKLFLLITTLTAIGGTIALFFPLPHQTLVEMGRASQLNRALFWFVVANIGFEMGGVFYNAFLPDLATQEKIGRLSGFGWGLGYVGGLLCMAVGLVGLVFPEEPWFGLSTEAAENVRATNLLVAIWFGLFSLPLFLFVREDKSRVTANRKAILHETARQIATTFSEIRDFRQIVRLLAARLFYNDGLVTIFAFGGIYAAGTFDFSMNEIMIFGIVLNVAAGAGAFAFGYIDDRVGGKRTIQVTLAGLALAAIIAVSAPGKIWLWVAGIIVGIFAGPNQSASRSLLGRFVPPDRENEFFGFFAFSGKATAFLGPLFFGILTQAFGTQRAGVAVVLAFFLLGWLILNAVDESEGIRLASRESV